MNQIQAQKQDYSQLQRKKQDQVHCNNSFGMLLSSMESFLIKSGYNISVLFGHYNHFNDISWKKKDEIRAQLYTDLMAYKIQKMAYTKKYHKFDFPDNPPIEEIIKMIEKWKKIAKNKDEQKLCDEILDLINDTNTKPISYYQNRVESCPNSSHADPIESVKLSNKIHNKIDKRNEEINKEIEKNPNAKFGLVIGEEPGKSEFSKITKDPKKQTKDDKIKKKENKIVKKVEELIKSVDNYFKEKEDFEIELQEKTNKISQDLEEYYKENQNIDFIFTKIHKDQTIKKLNKQIKTFDNSIEILKNIKEMLIKYDEN